MGAHGGVEAAPRDVPPEPGLAHRRLLAREPPRARARVRVPPRSRRRFEPAFEADPDELLEIAAALDDLRRGPQPTNPELAQLRVRLLDRNDRTTWQPVPAAIAGHVPCYVPAIFLDRGAMPDGWLADSLFPLLAAAVLATRGA